MRPLEIHSTSLSLSYFVCKMGKLPLGLSWRSSLIRNSQVLCQGKRYCRVLLCSHSYDLPLGHYLSFCCVFCNMFCLIFSGSFHLSTQEESVSLGCDPESCDLWFCAISSTSNGLPYSSVTFRKWNENKKQSSSPGFWRFSKVPISFGGNEFSESWTQISLGACK